MASFNRVILMGNLTRDPEVRQAQNGTYICKASLAVNERMPDGNGGYKEEPSFIDMVVFGRRGEAFGKYMQKGRPVMIEGKLRQSRWEDKESGQKRSKLEVIVDDWNFVGGREENQGSGGGGGYGGGQARAPQAQGSAPSSDFPSQSDFGGGGGGMADDVPF
jgi:single-strand DNA-binding protein